MSINAGNGPDWFLNITAVGRGQPLYMLLYVSAIVFAFFYTSVVFSAKDTADNIKIMEVLFQELDQEMQLLII